MRVVQKRLVTTKSRKQPTIRMAQELARGKVSRVFLKRQKPPAIARPMSPPVEEAVNEARVIEKVK